MDPTLYYEMARTQDEHWWFRARREILKRIISAFQLPPRSGILEIGCGAGGNLQMLKGFGQVEAVEMDRFAREHARTVSGVNVKAGYLPDHLPFENERFDLVCLFDVLEHVKNDQQALVEVGRLLKAGGKALITVPAYQWLYGAHDRAHHHFRRYAKTELRQKAVTAGLKPLRIGYYNMLLFPAVVPSRLVDQITDKKTVDEMTLPNRWLNRILYQIFASEAVVIPHFFFPFGTSVIAVLEPK